MGEVINLEERRNGNLQPIELGLESQIAGLLRVMGDGVELEQDEIGWRIVPHEDGGQINVPGHRFLDAYGDKSFASLGDVVSAALEIVDYCSGSAARLAVRAMDDHDDLLLDLEFIVSLSHGATDDSATDILGRIVRVARDACVKGARNKARFENPNAPDQDAAG
ncbi:hypothetical protein [Azotobacter beijerinckii]|uniref:Uncharacterized protein n=1 Tax=Azotobacter beijerinckii TaxID=170623 RepID=A0A1I4IY87_9GAMM|nr:hypothetical protein [Azotobacter beijerinckii]SFB64743.1 hypothetical protein SAMN04244571_04717 [Azotobacter beijerinckii]SFL58736.1 hypothetical protein SAMN04244574_04713 [Azotobacter beijerinckii]